MMPLMPAGVEITTKNAEIVRQGLENFNAEVVKIGRMRLRRIANEMRKQIVMPPPPYTGGWKAYGIHRQEQQQAVYLQWKKKGFPEHYERSGRYESAWRIVKNDSGYTIIGGENLPKPPVAAMARNSPSSYLVFVGGDVNGVGQYWMHEGRWALIADVVMNARTLVPTEIQKEVGIVAKRLGFAWSPPQGRPK